MTQAETSLQPFAVPRTIIKADPLVYGAIAAAGITLWWLTRAHVSWLPVWAPWEFSFVEFFGAWLTVWWYVRGLMLMPTAERPSIGRTVSFFIGMLVIYSALETRYEYLAEHQFFFNRIQHVGMHHLGPFLIALSWPGATLRRGAPSSVIRLFDHPALRAVTNVLQQPVIAGVLFVGLIFFWLTPSIHFRAMIDPRLFSLMNWSMVVDGLLFWFLVLDPRPTPPARISFGARAALSVLTILPQIIGGAMIAFSPKDLYSFYDLCGRIYPELGAHYDQTVGGLIIWIPPGMMGILGLVLVLNFLRKAEERNLQDADDENDTGPIIQASQWTG
ncbi:MAG TPA: cytochrome c oxidase assembly protein [Pseudolabrys sp.]|jgi:putative membrane protein|nr:cytochrome c oxidase assembly protein [Pseudolabrys sp.]